MKQARDLFSLPLFAIVESSNTELIISYHWISMCSISPEKEKNSWISLSVARSETCLTWTVLVWDWTEEMKMKKKKTTNKRKIKIDNGNQRAEIERNGNWGINNLHSSNENDRRIRRISCRERERERERKFVQVGALEEIWKKIRAPDKAWER